MSYDYQFQTVIPEDHPALKGHFPGNPVVPGVVVLESVAQALASWQPGLVIVELPVVKFHHVLKPAQLFEIRLQQKNEDGYRFECDCAGQVIASGSFTSKAVT